MRGCCSSVALLCAAVAFVGCKRTPTSEPAKATDTASVATAHDAAPAVVPGRGKAFFDQAEAAHAAAVASGLTGGDPQATLARAAALYEKACDAGFGRGCASLGLAAQDGVGIPADPKRALELYRRGCDLGAGVGCFNIGLMYDSGSGVAVDHDRADAEFRKAIAVYQKACDAGDQGWCMNLGVMYESGFGVPADPKRAVAIYRSACDRGNEDACVNLAMDAGLGRGMPLDPALSNKLMKESCDRGHPLACQNLGMLMVNGVGMKRDMAGGLKLLDGACRKGNNHACTQLGSLMVDAPTPSAPAKARALLTASCAAASSKACVELARLEMHQKQYQASVDHLERGCHIGSTKGCFLAGMMYQRGKEIPADLAKAIPLYRRACSFGDQGSCRELQNLNAPLTPPAR